MNHGKLDRAVTLAGTDRYRAGVVLLCFLVYESPPGSVPGGAFDAKQGHRT
ncbi:MAG: hypothetical protein KatS3mg077_2384 [Candidatus Binatia bacterium]|nr:MAG: hypothetical protein KatS3mg077_2384 [Candidatus Binatia bacterium]